MKYRSVEIYIYAVAVRFYGMLVTLSEVHYSSVAHTHTHRHMMVGCCVRNRSLKIVVMQMMQYMISMELISVERGN